MNERRTQVKRHTDGRKVDMCGTRGGSYAWTGPLILRALDLLDFLQPDLRVHYLLHEVPCTCNKRGRNSETLFTTLPDQPRLLDAGYGNTASGYIALLDNHAGHANTAVGYNAGNHLNVSTGSNSTFVGAFATAIVDGLNNATAIGYNAQVGESNALVLGSSGANAPWVGIGTTTPQYILDVQGGTAIRFDTTSPNILIGQSNDTTKFRVDNTGKVFADGGYASSGADFAESVAVQGSRSQYGPGDVMEIYPTVDRHLALSHHAYSTSVAGIYSTKPGVLATPRRMDDPEIENTEVPLAVVGIVPCKVTAENGPIARGDLLVTSSRPGYAMKGTDRSQMLGAVVGKAMEPLPMGTGMIQVLATLQ